MSCLAARSHAANQSRVEGAVLDGEPQGDVAMRGRSERQRAMFVAFDVEERVPADHPPRAIKRRCDAILAAISRDFDRACGRTGRVGIPPDSLPKALLLRALFGVPSRRRLCEACKFNVLCRWFIDRPLEEPTRTPETLSTNRERAESRGPIGEFFELVVAEGIGEGLVGDDRFAVDGALVRSLAGHKSARPVGDGRDDDAASGAGAFLRAVESRGITPHMAMPWGKIRGEGVEHEAHRRMRRRLRSRAYRVSRLLPWRIEPVIGRREHIGGLGRLPSCARRTVWIPGGSAPATIFPSRASPSAARSRPACSDECRVAGGDAGDDYGRTLIRQLVPMTSRTRLRSAGSTSRSNHGFRLAHIWFRGDGCGSTIRSGSSLRAIRTPSVRFSASAAGRGDDRSKA